MYNLTNENNGSNPSSKKKAPFALFGWGETCYKMVEALKLMFQITSFNYFGNGSFIHPMFPLHRRCNSCLRFETWKEVVFVIIIFFKIILAIETSCLYCKDFYSTHLSDCIFNWVILTWDFSPKYERVAASLEFRLYVCISWSLLLWLFTILLLVSMTIL